MKNNNRRSFIMGSAAAGFAVAGPMAAFAVSQAALADVDRPVAKVLASYGSARSVETRGNVARITVDVSGFQPFADSFGRFAKLSDSVRVENDNVTFQYGKTTYHVENRAA